MLNYTKIGDGLLVYEHLNGIILLQFQVWKMATNGCPLYHWCPGRKRIIVNRYLAPKFFETLRSVEKECRGQNAKEMLQELKKGM